MADAGVPLPARGSTRTVGIIGWPVQESLSPLIHNAAFAALGMDWAYIPLPVAPAELHASWIGKSQLQGLRTSAPAGGRPTGHA